MVESVIKRLSVTVFGGDRGINMYIKINQMSQTKCLNLNSPSIPFGIYLKSKLDFLFAIY